MANYGNVLYGRQTAMRTDTGFKQTFVSSYQNADLMLVVLRNDLVNITISDTTFMSSEWPLFNTPHYIKQNTKGCE